LPFPSNCERNPATKARTETIQQKLSAPLLSDDQKKSQMIASQNLLSMLRMYAKHDFEGITTGDKSWFQSSSDSDSMFADSRESIVPRIRQDISAFKTMITIFFTSKRLSGVGCLPRRCQIQSGLFHSVHISTIVS
jgi:hypothetical protein